LTSSRESPDNVTSRAAVQYFGFRIGSDKKLVRGDQIVEYRQAVANGADRVKFRNLGSTTNGNPFILLESIRPKTCAISTS